jgi:gamma-glutamyltranspeptidase / glutathione hydrolase
VTVPFSWQLPYPWPRTPVLARNVVATSQPLAAQAGLQMIADGGTAVDAILATAITLTLVEPVSNGIGSDAFAIVADGAQIHGLNASGRSPAAWTPEYFNGNPVPALGWNSVTVPGAVSAWVALHARFGRLPFAKLFEPAIYYGRNGFPVSPAIAAQWAQQVPLFANQPGFAEAFLPDGRAPRPGQIFKLPAHAATLD